jgi:hypothetical protein
MTATATRPARHSTEERVLLWLEALLALGAYGGAIGLLSGGIDLGASTADLPFGSTVFAGIALGIVNGVLPTAVLVGALRDAAWVGTGHWLVGAALTMWIVVQVGFLGWPPHWLQILYFCYGLAILALAHRVRRAQGGVVKETSWPVAR